MKNKPNNKVNLIAWGLSVFVSLLAIVAWAQSYAWQFAGMSAYRFFGLLGLLAFSLMWAHYVAAAVKNHLGADKDSLKLYFESTSILVLVLILLHPGLLIWSLWRDGLGLPPGGLLYYAGVSAYWAIVLGAVALVAFLAYELRRFFGDRSWWRFVQYASDVAMFLIFFHGLKLGGVLSQGWYRGVWYFYGAALLFVLYRQYAVGRRTPSPPKTH